MRSFLFFDISGSAPLLVSGDDVSATAIPLGFDFPLYGTSYSALTFATNGYISTDPTDTGPDLSNDSALPTVPSTGGGSRIYAHHDDTEANIYGDFYAADANPLGVDAYVAQFDACHFSCDPNVFDIQYNVFLLRDGTVVMAHNLAGPENGSGATVGLQNEAADDGVAYFANEAGALVDGQTVLILPRDSGLSQDLRNAAAESGANETALLSDSVNSHVFSSVGDGSVTSRDVPLTFSTMGKSGINLWGATGFSYSKVQASNPVRAMSYGVMAGVDLIRRGDLTAGVGVSLSFGAVDMGLAEIDTGTTAAFAYAGYSRGKIKVSGLLGYGMTDYSDFSTPFLTGISADGNRIFGALSASSRFEVGQNLVFTPGISVMAGKESIDDWTVAGGPSRSVEDASFVRVELTNKVSTNVQFLDTGGTAYFKVGVDFVRTYGDSNIALYSFNHDSERVGGIVGLGIDGGNFGGTAVSASLTATGIGSDNVGVRGGLSIKF